MGPRSRVEPVGKAHPKAHPAKYSREILPLLRFAIRGSRRVLDPFAGCGTIHAIHANAVGIEIEPEWAEQHERTICADALDIPRLGLGTFDAICTSPVYGNRMSDHHNARDDSKRNTYTHVLGRELHRNNAGRMHFGRDGFYEVLHKAVWRNCVDVLEPGGKFVLNTKDFIRRGRRMRVTDWHVGVLTVDLGLELVETYEVECPGLGFGANADIRVEFEDVSILRKVAQ